VAFGALLSFLSNAGRGRSTRHTVSKDFSVCNSSHHGYDWLLLSFSSSSVWGDKLIVYMQQHVLQSANATIPICCSLKSCLQESNSALLASQGPTEK